MSGIVGSKLNIRGSGRIAKLGTDGQVLTSAGAGVSAAFEAASGGGTSWQSVETGSTLTAVAGNGYPVNTTAQACTVTLPAGSVGDEVVLVDYAGTWDTNNLTIAADGSEKIKGSTDNVKCETERTGVKLTYVDATQGWIVTSAALEDQPALSNKQYIAATGPDSAAGTTDGDYKYHRFTSTKTGANGFSVSAVGNATGSNTVEYLVVGGGAAGGINQYSGDRGTGGGGAGAYRAAAGFSVSVQDYTVTIGAGGAANSGSGGHTRVCGGDGGTSTFSTIDSDGGGGGGGHEGSGASPANIDQPGHDSPGNGSGGGGAGQDVGGASGDYGNDGYDAEPDNEGGGGGGSSAGADGSEHSPNGGAGTNNSITGSEVGYAGGGAGYSDSGPWGTATHGGGAGDTGVGTANTGGGGSGESTGGLAGGSGIVILRYKFQN